MTQSTFDASGDARRALQFVYANYGAAAIDDPKMLNTLLPDLLPGEPLEAHLLLAAAGGGVGRLLRDRIASIPAETAVRDVAAMLVARNALDPRACRWVVAEYATALGHPVTISPDPPGTTGPPPIGNESATRPDSSSPGTVAPVPAPLGTVAPVFAPQPMTPTYAPPPISPTTPYPYPPPQYIPPRRSNAPLVAGVVIGILIVVGGAVGGIVAYTGHHGHTTPPTTPSPAALVSLLPDDVTVADDCTTNNEGDAPGMSGILAGYECDEPDGSTISGGHIEAYQFRSGTALAGSLSAVNEHVAFDQTGDSVHATCPPADSEDGYLHWSANDQDRGVLECYHTDQGECAYIWTDESNLALFYADTSGQDCSDMEDWWKNETGAD